jgi:Holliday junction resolvasome RuvABC endonuclease subunit
VFNIAENASLIKQFMSLNEIKFTTPSPSQVKKNFTGKGNSKKDAMVEEFHRRFPEVVLHDLLKLKPMAKPIDDICDSFAVLLCHEHFTKVTQ